MTTQSQLALCLIIRSSLDRIRAEVAVLIDELHRVGAHRIADELGDLLDSSVGGSLVKLYDAFSSFLDQVEEPDAEGSR